MAQFHEHDMIANKFMDKKHMDKVLQKTSYKTERPCLRPSVLEKSEPSLSLIV